MQHLLVSMLSFVAAALIGTLTRAASRPPATNWSGGGPQRHRCPCHTLRRVGRYGPTHWEGGVDDVDLLVLLDYPAMNAISDDAHDAMPSLRHNCLGALPTVATGAWPALLKSRQTALKASGCIERGFSNDAGVLSRRGRRPRGRPRAGAGRRLAEEVLLMSPNTDRRPPLSSSQSAFLTCHAARVSPRRPDAATDTVRSSPRWHGLLSARIPPGAHTCPISSQTRRQSPASHGDRAFGVTACSDRPFRDQLARCAGMAGLP